MILYGPLYRDLRWVRNHMVLLELLLNSGDQLFILLARHISFRISTHSLVDKCQDPGHGSSRFCKRSNRRAPVAEKNV